MYYFLIAQLPYLSYGQAPPVSSAELKELCGEYLLPGHFKLLRHCVCGIPEGAGTFRAVKQDFIDKWRKRERALIHAMARLRAARLKTQLPPAEHWDMDAENQAKAAVAMDNPLEAELFLDKGRWDAVEQLQRHAYFIVTVRGIFITGAL